MIWNLLLFVIGSWLTITPLSDMQVTYSDSVNIWTDTTSVILVEFSEPMDTAGLTTINNYKVYDSTNTIVKIYRIGLVKMLDDAPPTPPIIVTGNTLVALITKRIKQHSPYCVQVFNVKDVAGNLISNKNEGCFFFNGFVPHRIITPVVELRSD